MSAQEQKTCGKCGGSYFWPTQDEDLCCGYCGTIIWRDGGSEGELYAEVMEQVPAPPHGPSCLCFECLRLTLEAIADRHGATLEDLQGYAYQPHLVAARKEVIHKLGGLGLSRGIIASLMNRTWKGINQHWEKGPSSQKIGEAK